MGPLRLLARWRRIFYALVAVLRLLHRRSLKSEHLYRLKNQSTGGKNKALLVGIDYSTSAENENFCVLNGPHHNVEAMRKFLIECGFYNSDITVMIDTADAGDLAPTRDNLEREIRRLSAHARPGDSLVFLYVGHSGQVKALDDPNEHDGKDEFILPMDHHGLDTQYRHLLLIDDDLRKWLVDPLPNGAKLTAILDCCHSGTLLDLNHDRCNDVSPKEELIRIVRTVTRVKSIFRRRTYISTRTSVTNVQTRRLSIEMQFGKDGSSSGQIILESSNSTFETQEPSAIIEPVVRRVVSRVQSPNRSRSVSVNLTKLDTQRAKAERPKCNGNCPTSPTERQNVVSISACRDGQITFEDNNGYSLTHAFIEVLREHMDKLITFRELLTRLRCHINQTARIMHNFCHEKKGTCNGATPSPGALPQRKCSALEKKFYTWHPQYGSQKRLDLDAPFSLKQ